MFPNQRIDHVSAEQVGTVNDDSIRVSAQSSAHRRKGERLGRCKLEAGGDKESTSPLLEIVSAIEDLTRPGGKIRRNPPVVLHPAQTFVPDNGHTEVWPRQFGGCRRRALDRVVDGAVDRLEREVGPIQIKHREAPQYARKNRARSEAARRWPRVPYRSAPRRDRAVCQWIRPDG